METPMYDTQACDHPDHRVAVLDGRRRAQLRCGACGELWDRTRSPLPLRPAQNVVDFVVWRSRRQASEDRLNRGRAVVRS